MSDQDQGQPIDPSKMIGGRRAMTQSHRREKKNADIPKKERGKGRRGDGSRTSQATQVEYLDYQEQIHDATDGGYVQQYIPHDVGSNVVNLQVHGLPM